MDLFKNFRDLKTYCSELSTLMSSICTDGAKVKIGKFKIVETPSKDAAKRLCDKLNYIIETEHIEMANIYKKIEATLEEIQMDLFKRDENKEVKKEEKPVKFGAKTK